MATVTSPVKPVPSFKRSQGISSRSSESPARLSTSNPTKHSNVKPQRSTDSPAKTVHSPNRRNSNTSGKISQIQHTHARSNASPARFVNPHPHPTKSSSSGQQSAKPSRTSKALSRAKRAAALLLERRLLIGVTVFCTLGFVLWLSALSTSYWIWVLPPPPTTSSPSQPHNRSSELLLLGSHAGLWRLCTIHANRTETCEYHELQAPENKPTGSQAHQSIMATIYDYRRTKISLAVISICVMAMAVSFSIYTFINPRYTFKRLAAGVHFLTAATVIVLIEVCSGAAAYESVHLLDIYPPGSIWHFGYSYFCAWVTFVVFAAAGILFLVYSRKKKGERAINEELAMIDEPQIMGR